MPKVETRHILRNQAKKEYKKQIKGVKKSQRIPFSEFYKRFKKMKAGQGEIIERTQEAEDFDLDEFINELE